MSEIIKDENADLRLKIHAAEVNMQAYKHTVEMMDLTFGVDNAIKSLNRYREDTLNSIRKAHGIASFCDKVTVLPIILNPNLFLF